MLWGGSGADVFAFADGFQIDVVQDWEAGFDMLNFTEFSEINTYTDFTSVATVVGADVVYDLGGDSLNKIVFSGTTLASFNELDFEFGLSLIA